MPPKGHKQGCGCAVCAPNEETRSAVLAAGRKKRAANVELRRAQSGRTVHRGDYGDTTSPAGPTPARSRPASSRRGTGGGSGGTRRQDAGGEGRSQTAAAPAPAREETPARRGFFSGVIEALRG